LKKELAECRQKLKDEQALVKEKITELEKCNTYLSEAEKKLNLNGLEKHLIMTALLGGRI